MASRAIMDEWLATGASDVATREKRHAEMLAIGRVSRIIMAAIADGAVIRGSAAIGDALAPAAQDRR